MGWFRDFIGRGVDGLFPGDNYVNGQYHVTGRQLGLGLGALGAGLFLGPVAGKAARYGANKLDSYLDNRQVQGIQRDTFPVQYQPVQYQPVQMPSLQSYIPPNWLANPQGMRAQYSPPPNQGGLGGFGGGGGGFQSFSPSGGFGAGMGYGQGRGLVGSGVGSSGGGLGSGYGSLGGYTGIFGRPRQGSGTGEDDPQVLPF